jgi:hypothetical protein
VVRTEDLFAIADRLERGQYTDRDLVTAARLARHAATEWVRNGASVSLK